MDTFLISWECLIYNIYFMAKQFSELKSRKDVHKDFLKDGGTDIPKDGKIGNVNSLSNFDFQTAGNFISPAPPSPDNLQYSKNVSFLRSYFKDGTMHHFKNGLELANKTGDKANVSNIENLDEDPIIFGFDFIINTVTSPIYNEINNFFDFAQRGNNDIKEIINRRSVYSDFIEHLELLFLSTRGGPFDTFKGHYLIGIDGVGDLINKSTGLGSDKQFTDFGKDKITLNLREDVHLSGGYLTTLYNTLAYSKINGKQIIPDNLLRFDGTIVISEMRNYKKVKKALSGEIEDTQEVLRVVSDNVSRYMYNVYDCQFFFDKHSHPTNVRNDSREVTDNFDMSFYYKFSSMEMEKFKISPDSINSKYLNDGNRENPTRRYIGEQTENINAVRRNEFINSKYQENLDSYEEYGDPTSNNIKKDFSVVRSSEDSLEATRHNSIKADLEEQERRREELRKEASEKQKRDRLKKGEENNISGYENIDENGKLTRQEARGKRGGLGDIISKSKDFALNVIRLKRNMLIDETVRNIRRSTGIRRITQPENVYDFDPLSIGGFVRNELRDFTGGAFTDLLGGIDDAI